MAYQLRALSRWEEELVGGKSFGGRDGGESSDEDSDDSASSEENGNLQRNDGQKELQERCIVPGSLSLSASY
jgi:hypothetical protein